jgi:hypothetical protein
MKKYLIDGEEVSSDEFDERLEYEVSEYCSDNYDEWIDEVSDEVVIGSLHYSPSQVLQAVDPIAYSCGVSDYESSELSDAQYALKNGDREYTVNNILFEVKDDSDDEGDE